MEVAVASTLAQLIARMEGWLVPGSIAQRNNNPGNLRNVGQAGAVGTRDGYAVFATPQAGWDALDAQIRYDAGRGLTLQQFIFKYAPPSDNNDTVGYLNFLTDGLGVPASTPLSSLAAGIQVPGDGLSLPSFEVPSWASTNLLILGAIGSIFLLAVATRD